MNLDDEQESSNIVDRRGERGGGGGMRLPIGGGKLGEATPSLILTSQHNLEFPFPNGLLQECE